MLWIVLLLASPVLLAQTAAEQQVARGESLFFDAAKGCASCHAMKGRGSPVGPDLTVIGRVSPPAIATAIRSTVTQYVQNAKLKTGPPFPAMPGPKDDKTITLYDLSKTPPQARKVEQAEIERMSANDSWKHPPAVTKYTNEETADVIAYIMYVATGRKKSVDPADVR